MLGQRTQIEDPRMPLQKMRVWPLRDLAKQKGLHEAGYDVDNMTKDQLLHVLDVEQYRPATRPLSSDPDNAPLEAYEDFALTKKAWELGIAYDPAQTKEDLIAAIRAAEAVAFSPDPAPVFPQPVAEASEAAPPFLPPLTPPEAEKPEHSLESLREMPIYKIKQMPKWALVKLANDMGIPHQVDWRNKDFHSAIEERRG